MPFFSIKSMICGGEGGIRTHGGRKPTTVFETAAFDHSATSPRFRGRLCGGGVAGSSEACKSKIARPKTAGGEGNARHVRAQSGIAIGFLAGNDGKSPMSYS